MRLTILKKQLLRPDGRGGRRPLLPSASDRFAVLNPGVKPEVQIGNNAELIPQLNAGRLGVTLAKRPLGTPTGIRYGVSPLVQGAAD